MTHKKCTVWRVNLEALLRVRIRLIILMRIRILIFIRCGSGFRFLIDADSDPTFHMMGIRILLFSADPDPAKVVIL
jgi:hypothetical protein